MDGRPNSRSKTGDEVLGAYLREVHELPRISPDEECALGRRIQQGDREALDHLVRANLRLVIAIAKQYANRGLALADLINEGNVGLIKAAERFDPEAGCRFSTYSAWWIKQGIRRALVNTARTVRVPSYMVEVIAKLKTTSTRLERELEREPTFDEIAHAMGVEDEGLDLLRRAVRAARSGRAAVSLESMLGETDSLADDRATTPDEQLVSDSDRSRLESLLASIDPREAEVLKLRYGIDVEAPLTLREIGERLGVSRERIRQIETRALRKLSDRMASHPDEGPGTE